MTLAEFDRDVGIVFLGFAVLVAVGGVIKFLAQRSARSAEPVTETPGSRPVTSSAVVASGLGMDAAPEERRLSKPEVAAQGSRPQQLKRQRTPLAATTEATEDSGGEVAVPASEAEATGPTEALITQPREDPAVLGRDRAQPWSW